MKRTVQLAPADIGSRASTGNNYSAMGASRQTARSAAARRATSASDQASTCDQGRLFLVTLPVVLALVTALILASCAPTTIKHGHQFRASDLAQVQPGMSKEQVTQVLGTPDTTSAVSGGEGYYYISSVEEQTSFFKPDEVDRKIVAVYFNKLESVDRLAHYGLKDGKVFDFNNRETGTHARDEGILKALFRNLGKKQGLF